MRQVTLEDVVGRIRDYLDGRRTKQRVRWTIERGQGETYRSDDWTLYAHDRYPRGSVLSGQARRTFVMFTGPENRHQLLLIKACEEAGLKQHDVHVIDGTTHTPIADMVRHLPDTED